MTRHILSAMVARTALTAIPALVVVALVLGGCDDGSGQSGDDTAMLDTAGGDATSDLADQSDDGDADDASDGEEPCCNLIDCMPAQTCDPELCECVGASTCEADGDPCSPDVTQPDGFVCVGLGASDGTGVCRTACETAEDCAGAEVCVSADGTLDAGGWCQADECTDFFTDDCADPDTTCSPVAADVDICVAPGAGQALDACAALDECADGLICYAGRCIAPGCHDDGSVSCADAEDSCRRLVFGGQRADVGLCETECRAFTADSGCETGEWCRPLGDDNLGNLVGRCVPEMGAGAEGDACADTLECETGLICRRGVCKAPCDPEATDGDGTCTDTKECVPLFEGSFFESAVGLCLEPCELFVDECGEREWCRPNYFTDTKHCTPGGGTVGEGEECLGFTQETTCQDGSVCLEVGDCRPVCDPDAADGEAGACAEGRACFPFADGMGGTQSFGFCVKECDYHGGDTTCDDPTRTHCAPGEIFFQDFDLCALPPEEVLEPNDDCEAAGIAPLALCGPNAICVEAPDGSLVCKDVCAVSEGDFGATHPDCRDDTETCEPIFGSGEPQGLCL